MLNLSNNEDEIQQLDSVNLQVDSIPLDITLSDDDNDNTLNIKNTTTSNSSPQNQSNNKKIENVRIVGPCRKYTQVELLEKDCEYLGINPPIRSSGDLKGSESITIVGPHGTYEAVESTIISDRHIHMSSEDLKEFNVLAK